MGADDLLCFSEPFLKQLYCRNVVVVNPLMREGFHTNPWPSLNTWLYYGIILTQMYEQKNKDK